jgi:hypothetical protein
VLRSPISIRGSRSHYDGKGSVDIPYRVIGTLSVSDIHSPEIRVELAMHLIL